MNNTSLPDEIRKSYEWCREVTKRRARNFYFGIVLLPQARRDALCAIYAFFRECDDISDGAGVQNRRERLEHWKKVIKGEIAVPDSSHPGLPALRHATRKYHVDIQNYLDLIDGTIMDLDEFQVHTFEDMYRYCYHVASTVGLVCISVFGCENRPEVRKMAEYHGIAFQITNILRDIYHDADEGRVYIPDDILARFGLDRQTILEKRGDEQKMAALIKYISAIAEDYYAKSEFLPCFINPQSRLCLRAMTNIYYGLLKKIEQAGTGSLKQKVRLSLPEKLWAILRAYASTCIEYLYEIFAPGH